MSDFDEPTTALGEMTQRIRTLRKQADRDRSEAANLRAQAAELDASAERRTAIADEYAKVRNGRGGRPTDTAECRTCELSWGGSTALDGAVKHEAEYPNHNVWVQAHV